MGAARRRGTYEDRKAAALAVKRLEDEQPKPAPVRRGLPPALPALLALALQQPPRGLRMRPDGTGWRRSKGSE